MYYDELQKAMTWLGRQSNTLFFGQSVKWSGTGMFNSLKDIPDERKIESPIFENTQVGIGIGMSLTGIVPILIIPRINFLLSAMDQIVNHLDKLELMSDQGYKPHVIIRTAIGSINPLNPGFQHQFDYTDGLKSMCKNIEIIKLDEPEQIFPAYQMAYERLDRKPSIICEVADYYNTK